MEKKIILIALVTLIAVAPALGSGKKKIKSKRTTTISMVKRGKDLYRQYQCSDCHSIDGQGNLDGVSLDKIGKKRSREFLIEQILDPEKHVENNPKAFKGDTNLMPPQQLEKAEASAIVDYLKTLK